MIAFGLSGTSSGLLREYLYGPSEDPALIAGSPRPIRSDEWLVSTPVLLAQIAAGFPEINTNFAGGLDMSMVYDVPYWGWSVVLKPQQWALLLLPAGPGMAWKWFLPAVILLLSCYALVIQLLPGKRLFAAATAGSVWLAGFSQWWGPGAVAPIAWSLAVMALVTWLLSTDQRGPRIASSFLLAYAVAAFGVLLYPAFQIPCVLVILAYSLGLFALRLQESSPARRPVLERAGLAVGAAVLGAVACVGYLATRFEVVRAFQGTAYPGERVIDSGGFTLQQLFVGFFGPNLLGEEASTQTPLASIGGNQSESSAFLLIGLLLLAVQVWLLVRGRSVGRPVNGVLVGLVTVGAFFLGHLFLVSADVVAPLLGLTQVPFTRLHIGLGLLSTLMIVATAWELDRQQVRAPWLLAGGTGVAVWLLLVEVGRRVDEVSPVASGGMDYVLVVALLVAATCVALARGLLWQPAVALLAFTVWAGAGVNPVYRGVFDAGATPVGAAIRELSATDPSASWVSLSGIVGNAVIVESSVPTFSAAFSHPRRDAWTELDPTGKYEDVYNRYGHVVFQNGLEGEPLQNPQGDIILVRFDACEPFAQQRVGFVLSEAAVDSPCLELARTVNMPARPFHLYRVRPSAAGPPTPAS